MSKSKQQYFLSLYKPVHERFARYCRAHAFYDMPCEDLINESLLVAFKKIDSLKNEEAFLSFLIGISARLLANARRKKKAGTVTDELVLTQYPDPNNRMEQQSEIERLYQGLAQLPDAQREALILFEITGFSIKEITQLQNSSESAVKQRLARGRKALAHILKNNLLIKR